MRAGPRSAPSLRWGAPFWGVMLWALMLAGCEPTPTELAEDGGADLSLDMASVADSSSMALDGAESGVEATAHVCGRLLASDGQLVAGHSMIVCDSLACYMGSSAADGRFCVEVYSAGDFRFHALERVVGERHYGDVYFPLPIDEQQLTRGERVDLGDVTLPLIMATATIDLASGGVASLAAGTLEFAAGAARVPTLAEQIDVGIARVPTEQLHPRLGAGEPVAAYLIVPSEARLSPAAPYALLAPEGLATDEVLQLFTVNGESGRLEDAGLARVNAAGMIEGLQGAGLASLGWLLFYRQGV